MREDTRIPAEGMVSLPLGLGWIGLRWLRGLLHPGLAGLVPLKTCGLEQFLLVEEMIADGDDHPLTVLEADAGDFGQDCR